MAIAWDPSLAAGDLWERLHEHFTEPQLVELGHFIALTLGQQRFLKTVGVKHGEVLADTDAGLAPTEAARVKAQGASAPDTASLREADGDREPPLSETRSAADAPLGEPSSRFR